MYDTVDLAKGKDDKESGQQSLNQTTNVDASDNIGHSNIEKYSLVTPSVTMSENSPFKDSCIILDSSTTTRQVDPTAT